MQFVADCEFRKAPAPLGSAFGQRRCNIDPRQGIGACRNRIAAVQDMLDQFLQMRRFCRQRMARRLRNPQCLLMQFRRVKPHCACHRLPMGKAAACRHQRVAIFRWYFDKIAEHAIVAYLQRGYARRGPIACLHRRHRTAAIAPGEPQAIQRGVIAFGDIAALVGFGRRRLYKSAAEQIHHGAMAV